MDSAERQEVRVGGRAVECLKIQLGNYRDEKRRKVEVETIIKKKLRIEVKRCIALKNHQEFKMGSFKCS